MLKANITLRNLRTENVIYFVVIDICQVLSIPLFLPVKYGNYLEITKQNGSTGHRNGFIVGVAPKWPIWVKYNLDV